MKVKENVPIVVFDNQCYLCMKFAKIIDFLARGKITIIGHYSDFGIKIRNEILDETALEMFWFIDDKKAYGGRAALIPLIKSLFSKKMKKSTLNEIEANCQQGCKTAKAVFVRSSSLFTNSKTIKINDESKN